MTNRRNESSDSRCEETRQAILDAALDLFQRYGIRKTTIEDIARAVGKRKSFLYYYFESKQAVLHALTEREFLGISQAIREAVGRAVGARAKLKAYFATRAEQLVLRLGAERRRNMLFAISEDMAEYLMINDFRRQFDEIELRFFSDLLREGAHDGVFRPLSDEDLDAFCQFSFSALRGLEFELMLLPTQLEDLVQRTEIATAVLLDGLVLQDKNSGLGPTPAKSS